MRLPVLLLVLCFSYHVAQAQTYTDSIVQFRKKYIADLLAEPRKPLLQAQVKNLDFFPPDAQYRVVATFTPSPGSVPFMVHTHSGKNKPFKEYGVLTFRIDTGTWKLHAYQFVDFINDAAHKDELFVPFNDMTNYETTYAGGRYIDLSISDIHDNTIMLDFNKCYNPYCAYSDGFSCPVPPAENYLRTEIRAGEKMFIR